jgi:hypothetical protein
MRPTVRTMKTEPAELRLLAKKIEATERKLRELAEEIDEIGEPASGTLCKRLEAISIEEHALQRNFAEAELAEEADAVKMQKIGTLLHHVEVEESSLEHEADFLHTTAPTTLEFVLNGSTRLFSSGARGVRTILGGHQLMWHSPFVNNTHETLSARFKMPRPK